jgi:hypothetical protein
MRTLAAYIAASLVTAALALSFFTQQVIAKQAAIGVRYTPEQQLQTYVENFLGLAPSMAASWPSLCWSAFWSPRGSSGF